VTEAPEDKKPDAKPDEKPAEPWSVRRTLRTASSEAYDVVAGDARVGVVAVHYADNGVEAVLTLPAGVESEATHGVVGWLTEMLGLDGAAGPGGVIHWVVSTGAGEDLWRRSPGRRTSGAEADLGAAKARVESVLGQMFPGGPTTLPDGGYAVDAGSVRVFVNVRPVDASVLVRVFAITNVDVQVDGDLPRFLLGLNFSLALGRFSLDAGKRAVWFDHVLTADQLDDGTLARTVAAVASTADKYDDELKERFGGRTFREEGSPVELAATADGPGMAGGYL
jgi:hypothetical protein